jgi:hypothetical protein
MRTRTVGILGYADDWVLYTRNHQMLRAQNNMQAALDRVAEWSEANGFRIFQEKLRPCIILKVVNTQRILGLILDRQLTWTPHIETVKAKCSKRLNLLRHLAGTQWGADQSTLLRVHKMLVLSAVKFRSAAYGLARKTQLKKLDPIDNKGLRIALRLGKVHSNRDEISKQRTWQ